MQVFIISYLGSLIEVLLPLSKSVYISIYRTVSSCRMSSINVVVVQVNHVILCGRVTLYELLPFQCIFFFFLCRTWTYAGVNQSCLAGPNINATCKITLSFCNKIPTICNGLSSACVQASNFTGKNDTAVFSIGQYTQDPFSRSEKGIKNVKNKF